MTGKVHVIGGGLAGSEAAWQLARSGVPAVVHEMRPGRQTEAHKTGAFAELVCSNSFRSDEWETNAVALLHALRALTGEAELAFFDAIAPIVHADSIDMTVCWRQSRYDKAGPGGGGAGYIHLPLDKNQYEGFIAALLAAERTAFKEFKALRT